MSKRNGLLVWIDDPTSTKPWVWVRTKPEGSPPSFYDVGKILRDIVQCEVIKYGGDPMDPADWTRWGRLPRLYVNRCFEHSARYVDLAIEFELPPWEEGFQ